MPDTFHWKLANPEAALKLISNDPLEKSSIDAKPIGLELEPSLSFGGDGKGTFALNVRGVLTVAASTFSPRTSRPLPWILVNPNAAPCLACP